MRVGVGVGVEDELVAQHELLDTEETGDLVFGLRIGATRARDPVPGRGDPRIDHGAHRGGEIGRGREGVKQRVLVVLERDPPLGDDLVDDLRAVRDALELLLRHEPAQRLGEDAVEVVHPRALPHVGGGEERPQAIGPRP